MFYLNLTIMTISTFTANLRSLLTPATLKAVAYLMLYSTTLCHTSWAQPLVSELFPARDNTLYEQDGLSNGSGRFLFVGNTAQANDSKRRALLYFAVQDSLPAGAIIDSVALQVFVSRARNAANVPIFIHRLTNSWGEGTSDAAGNEGRGTDAAPNDATWTQRFFNDTPWTSAGGDFDPLPSAEVTAPGSGSFTSWKSAGLAQDVQSWLDDPTQNHGWILIGDEQTSGTARQLGSRHLTTLTQRPNLIIYYQNPTRRAPRFSADLKVFPNPARTHLTIELTGAKAPLYQLSLINAQGQRVWQKQLTGPRSVSHRIDLSHFPQSVYSLLVQTPNGQQTQRKVVLLP